MADPVGDDFRFYSAVKRESRVGNPVLDERGQPIPLPINVNAKRFLFAEDPDVKFGSLDETPLAGFIQSLDMSIRHKVAYVEGARKPEVVGWIPGMVASNKATVVTVTAGKTATLDDQMP